MRKLQSFTLMNGKNTHTMKCVALYGLAADGFVPLPNKGIDIG